jgi:uncharacterized phage protein gp47/JayE
MPIKFDENGLVIQTLAEIKEERKAAYVAKYGAGFQVGDDTEPGKKIGADSEREYLLQEAVEGGYLSAYPSSALGIALDRVLEITDHRRLAAQPSTFIGTIFAAGTPSTVVPINELKMSADLTGDIFINSAEFTLGVLVDKTIDSLTRSGTTVTATIGGGHSFPLNSWVFIEGAEQEDYNGLFQITNITSTIFQYEITGTLPITPATGTILAKEATPFNAESEVDGAIQALKGAVNTISAAVLGVDRVENSADAAVGRDVETDAEARERRNETLSIQGGGTLPAIDSQLRAVDGVQSVIVFQNTGDYTDENGIPRNSVKAVVSGGTDEDIWNALFNSVSAGVRMVGTEESTVTDVSGNPQPVAFSRLTTVRIYVNAGNGLVTNSDPLQGDIFPADGNDQIIAALAAIEFQPGGDVWPATIKDAIISVDGVIDADPFFDITPTPIVKVTIPIAADSVANISSGDVTGL